MNNVKIGINDLWTTVPEIAMLLYYPNDGYLYTKSSTQKVIWKCPICGCKIEKSICSVVYNGLKCPFCQGKRSYPNRFMNRILQQLEQMKQITFYTREYCSDWCHYEYKGFSHRCIYDFYFEINTQKFIIEMDGGFHFEDTGYAKISLEDQKSIDSIKTQLANDCNIRIIRIDCNYGKLTDNRYIYIKNKIIESELSNIFDLNMIDFAKADIDANKSDILFAGKLYSQGVDVGEIASKLKVGVKTVRHYLKRATEIGICNYDAKLNQSKPIVDYNNMNKRKVVLLNTSEIFESIKDAEKSKYHPSNVYMVCCGMRNYSGVYNNERLVWKYYEDYLQMNKTDIGKLLASCKSRKIICLETNKVFENVHDAANTIYCENNLKGKSDYINRSCKTHKKAYGLHWMYYDEYEQMTESEKHSLLLCS